MSEKDILDGLKPICICKGIRKKTFQKHLAAGLNTVAALREATGAGSGPCGGRRCTPRIEAFLENYLRAGGVFPDTP